MFSNLFAERNRYTDILTYGKSRVILKHGVEQSDDKAVADYINACYVNSPLGSKKIIASQGPKPETTEHFWQMIVENNVSLIVSTCQLKENGRAKCNQFWPRTDKENFLISQADPNH